MRQRGLSGRRFYPHSGIHHTLNFFTPKLHNRLFTPNLNQIFHHKYFHTHKFQQWPHPVGSNFPWKRKLDSTRLYTGAHQFNHHKRMLNTRYRFTTTPTKKLCPKHKNNVIWMEMKILTKTNMKMKMKMFVEQMNGEAREERWSSRCDDLNFMKTAKIG
ncbi:hypothetical protein HanRHA438_Chr15g0693801 [Helianthus annuus]|nr:hypothetical protein HanRHA438_Chr15g0693801 [Helianthus annuus]